MMGLISSRQSWFWRVAVFAGALPVLAESVPPTAEAIKVLPALDVLADQVRPTAGGSGPATALNALRTVPLLELRSQGLAGGQTDLRIRGSSFSGAGLALGGLALRNPQTEHFNAELPLPAELLGTPQLFTGLAQARGTGGHLVGTVAYEFQPVEARGTAEAGAGEIGRNWQNLFWQLPVSQPTPAGQTGLSVFAGREHADRTDGYADNDLDRQTAGLHLQQRQGEEWQADLVAAVQEKQFGARGFYGTDAKWAAWEQLEDRLVLGSFRQGDLKDEYVRVTASWRQTEDTYRLDRNNPGLYENHHTTNVAAVNVDGAKRLAAPLLLRWRAEAEAEQIASVYHGTIKSTGLGNHRRENAGLTLLPEWSIREDLRLTLGGKAQVFSGDRAAWLPLAGVEYDMARNQTLYASYTETVRQPSYTELNYDSPGSLGNTGLQRQENQTVELGWKGHTQDGAWDWKTAVFHERSENAVDWIRATAASPRWAAVNLEPVETWGVETGGTWHPDDQREVGLTYAYLEKHCASNPYSSRYFLDYPEHDVTLHVRQRLGDWCELRVWQGVAVQVENPLRTSAAVASPAGAELRFRLPHLGATELVLAADNLWGREFQTFPGQPSAGRRCSLAVVTAW